MPQTMIERLFGVEGKVALVTGGTSGIGKLMAKALAEAGAKVYIVGRDEERCSKVAVELSSSGSVIALPGDLSSLSGLQKVVSAFSEWEAALHILINNAGTLEEQPLDTYSEELWDRTLSLNLKAPFFLSQALLPFLRKAGTKADPARIVNISSGHGYRISPFDHYGYTASKAGLNHLTRALAQKLAGENINVNAIAPGIFPSGLTSDFSPELVSRIEAGIPSGRVGRADDIAGSLLYLVSLAGAYTTSVVLPVDGGWAGIS